jgi:hypothetical protein
LPLVLMDDPSLVDSKLLIAVSFLFLFCSIF